MSEFPWLRLIKNGALLPLLFVDLFPSPSAPLHCPFIYSKSPLSTSLLHFPAIILSQLFAHSLPSLHQLFLLSTSLTSLTETNSDIHHLLPPFSLTIADCCRCLYRVLHFAVKCSWKGAFYNLSTPEYILSLSLSRSRSGQWSPADVFTSTPSSIPHLRCPPVPLRKVETEEVNWWVSVDKTRLEIEVEATKFFDCRTDRTQRAIVQRWNMGVAKTSVPIQRCTLERWTRCHNVQRERLHPTLGICCPL